MRDVLLYTTHCPRCEVLKKKLEQKEIPYIENDDVAEMLSLGITTVPVLKVDEEIMDFAKAVQWVNNF